MESSHGPCHLVVFGSTGHLARTKIYPALHALEAAGRLDPALGIVAVGRRPWDDAAWRAHLAESLEAVLGPAHDRRAAEALVARFVFVEGTLEDSVTYDRLLERLAEPRPGVCENIVFYLAIHTAGYARVIEGLDRVGLNRVGGRHRIVLEKPFGEDLGSARALNALLHAHFDETQIYRIDHFLGKETVQNLLVFRLANTLVEPLWNANHVDHVQITVAERDGVGSRAGYFDRAGTLRDMVQNHLLQLVTMVAMEPPASLDEEAVRDEKVKVLRSIRPLEPTTVHAHVQRGQYRAGPVDGVEVPGYLDEDGVAPGSSTETYVAARLQIDNWRWRGVPFYLRTGKRMASKRSVVALRFRHPPQLLFHDTPVEQVDSNWMVLTIQPEESMRVEVYAKRPGLDLVPRLVSLDTAYRAEHEAHLDAYETLLLDVIEGDRSLFLRFDEVEHAWQVMAPIQAAWRAGSADLRTYAAGCDGPDDGRSLFVDAAHGWREI